MVDLLVDFPSSRGMASASSSSEPVGEQNRQIITPSLADVPRHVRFAPTSSLTITEPVTGEELSNRWYSKRERDCHRRWFKCEVSMVAKTLATTPVSSIRQEEMYYLIGIEAYLSRDVLHSTKKHRTNHVRMVLAAQERQRMCETCDEEELSCLSRKSSAQACSKAAKIATAYWNVLE